MPIRSVASWKVKSDVCKFLVTKIFDVTDHRGHAEYGSHDDNLQAVDGGPESQAATNAEITHTHLQPPPNISPSIFRKFEQFDQVLGPGADKTGTYKNAEYYGYHVHSYTDLLVNILRTKQMRQKAHAKDKERLAAVVSLEEIQNESISARQEEPRDELAVEAKAKVAQKPQGEPNEDEDRIQLVCRFRDDNEEEQHNKLSTDEESLDCQSDNEMSDRENDPCECEDDEFNKLCEALFKNQTAGYDDEN